MRDIRGSCRLLLLLVLGKIRVGRAFFLAVCLGAPVYDRKCLDTGQRLIQLYDVSYLIRPV